MFSKALPRSFSPEQIFVLSSVLVNGGNYLYNIILGRMLGPTQFSDAALFVTLLLVLSFIAMTFQLGVTKFVATDVVNSSSIVRWIWKRALALGLCIGAAFIFFSDALQEIFKTESGNAFLIFGLFVPIYFAMSIRRGYLQGRQDFLNLSGSYQMEMWARLLLTLSLVLLWRSEPLLAVVTGIGFSFVLGLYPFRKLYNTAKERLSPSIKGQIKVFLWYTALYEGTQIICNNSDILLVKHYFGTEEAGLYASLALIGRVIYFSSWMLIMLLLPKVIKSRREGKCTKRLFNNYLTIITLLILVLLTASFVIPETMVLLLFGEEYMPIAPYLGLYAIATSLFAFSNLFVYYFMSLDRFFPIILSALFGILQIVGIMGFHNSFAEVIWVQIALMAILLSLQATYYRWKS
ncbi:oligosaccharide flippase family protein [Aureisphaera galaxeae]|uniref:oligosaccharide flippase family protein n=1 Tax=Aureisphaera galaxeae TaxID=1538023 RepID=UPI002350971C|nr:oligosaccharide flippase family protein [Aureisphaera galaxeae]MDC8005688.1 oligosaccharide flippase family protein [Aureisphaera galaxeae]